LLQTIAVNNVQAVASILYDSTLYDLPFSYSITRLGFGIP